VLSNVGPWMDDRHAECCVLWLSGELATPSMPWSLPFSTSMST
jgi:hypothetical protein